MTPDVPRPNNYSLDNPLQKVVSMWAEKIKKAWDFKREQFGKDADTCRQFFNGPYDFFYKNLYSGEGNANSGFSMAESDMNLPAPSMRMMLNKVAEGTQLFGPTIYHKNPYRQVNPRELPALPIGLMPTVMNGGVPPPPLGMPMMGPPPGPGAGPPPPPGPPRPPMGGVPLPGGPPGVINPAQIPIVNPQVFAMQVQEQQFQAQAAMTRLMDEARSKLLEWVLNYTPSEYGLKKEARLAVDEAIITGMSYLWPEPYTSPSGGKMIRSTWVSEREIIYDPDYRRREDCKWMARRWTMPVWEAERKFGLAPGTLKGYSESYSQQAAINTDPTMSPWRRARGESNDLFTYWEIYSKMGVGGRLPGVDPGLGQVLDMFGDIAFLCVCENCPFLLNVPEQLVASVEPGAIEAIKQRLEWPTPHWLGDSWPCEPLVFHEVPDQLYPMSHFKPAMGELMFLNWAYSCVASKIRVTSRDFLAVKQGLSDEMKQKILHGEDLTLLEIEATDPSFIKDMVQFLQHPQWNADIWTVIEKVEQSFEKRTGLSELMYGMSSKQLRSASEAEMKGDAINVRPDDMANCVEDWMSTIAKLEAMAVRWHVTAQDISPLMGPQHAYYWSVLIQGSDPYSMMHQLQYTIEAGSTRKANKDRDAANMRDVMQTVFPLAVQVAGQAAMAGLPNPFQQPNNMLMDWAKTMGTDGTKYLFPNIPPPPPPVAPGGNGDGGGEPSPNGPPKGT